jgi:copper chaperone CopZ
MQTSADAGDLMTADAPSTAGDTIVMTVHGMSCPLCATNVDKQLLRVRGVHSVEVDLSTGAVTMLVSEVSPPTDAQLMRAVEESGFTVAEPPRRP